MAVAAEEATELDEDGESLPVVVDVAVDLTEDKKERTEEVATVLLELSELGGGDPGGVVLKGTSRLCRVLLSALTKGDGFGRPVSSASLVSVLDLFSTVSNGAAARFLSFWQISSPKSRLGRAGSSPAR